jgi:hypothetical protein
MECRQGAVSGKGRPRFPRHENGNQNQQYLVVDANGKKGRRIYYLSYISWMSWQDERGQRVH